jgi:hypothetical protein
MSGGYNSRQMDEIHKQLMEDARQNLKQARDDSKEHMDRLERSTEQLDRKSMQSFAAWRDYLHKYYVLILAFISGSGVFISTQGSIPGSARIGIFLALGGVLIGFVAINLYFYFERRWFQISSYMGMGDVGELQSHPQAGDDIVLAIKLNLREKNVGYGKEIEEAERRGDSIKARDLKNKVRGNKSHISLMKYLGQQFGWIENMWIAFVVTSLVLTSAGVILVFLSVL